MTQLKSLAEMFDMRERTVLITGGAGILAEVWAEALAEYGANIVLADILSEKARERASLLKDTFKVDSQGIYLDLTSEKSIVGCVEETIDRFGTIDVLINNAQGTPENEYELFENYDKKTWDLITEVNLGGLFLMTKEVSKFMLYKKTGNIINIASIYGVVAPNQSIYEGSFYKNRQINSPAVYTVTKGGVIAFTKYLAAYFSGKNIRVNCISPGGVFSGQNDVFVKKYSERVPLKRMAIKEDLKGAIIFLASDASSYVNGHNLIIDGGLSIW